ncbi:NAD(P)H-quinone oxidoreductase [Prosthecomicrobium pneumaticum]|uniref:Putative PIG3 family NAD(P)H quinone oxidoreductase n=1 Tax=Prosthecomicrobium pneumaticum TaxID=81895 RepID=A0A7W9FKG4_9HYPH|nr:NAD(P)H-quinone oxidoreductase [Prosthecomicrobium pneumaticum]MBB5752636.1 putative PIG3 family NAD(P)H quinone oxidoreductase [Prosthecomicrobium pneumaticum]
MNPTANDSVSTMTAIVIRQPGGPEVLVPERRPVPQPGEGEILVRVAAAGVNRPDVLQRQGGYPPPKGAPVDIPGLEIAGLVAGHGPGAGRFATGDAVCALLPGGGYAEYAVVHESNALPLPTGFSMVEAAALPETFFTVWHNVFERGGLAAGETLLVHGGTSGIGTTAIQLARAFGATVYATAGSAEKCAACVTLGATAAFNHRTEDFVARLKAETGGKGADVILDMVGGAYVGRNYEAAAVDGRIVQIAFLEGSTATVDFTRLMVKRLTHTGSTLRPRPVAFKAGLAAALEAKVWPLLAARAVAPVIDATFPLTEAAAAHRRMEGGSHIGKIVLST